MSELELDGTTVTVFGNSDPLDRALNDELGRRGCNTHHVPVTTGWLRSASHAVVRVDSRSGATALQQLAERDVPRTHVVAVCSRSIDPADRDRVSALCRACGLSHDVSLIWHEPDPPRELAETIADEVVQNVDPRLAPAFAARVFAPGHARQ